MFFDDAWTIGKSEKKSKAKNVVRRYVMLGIEGKELERRGGGEIFEREERVVV